MYVQQNLTVELLPINTGTLPHNLEFLPISVTHNSFKEGIALFYRPPDSFVTIFDTLFHILESLDIAYFL